MRFRFIPILISICALPLSCGKIGLSVLQSSNKSDFIHDDDGTGLGNLQDRCGASVSDLSNPDFVAVQQTLKSLPITLTGTQDGFDYTVVTAATLNITGKSSSNISDANVLVQSVSTNPRGGESIAKVKADNATIDNSGRLEGLSFSSGQLLKLSNDNPMYKNMLCSVGFSRTQRDYMGEKGPLGEITFDLPTPLAMNPMASADTFAKELGNERTFKVTATVTVTKDGWAPVGSRIPLSIKWRKVTPTLKDGAGETRQDLPNLGSSIVAYEMTIDAGATAPSTIGLAVRRDFFIDTALHRFAAIVEETGKIDPGDPTKKKKVPVVVLIAQ